MDNSMRQLDGNAAAGLPAEIFAFDVTSAQAVRDRCHAVEPVASLLAYDWTWAPFSDVPAVVTRYRGSRGWREDTGPICAA